jgi:hypothetical protein
MDPKIGDYIRANHDRYAPEAIRAQLVNAGHDPTAIDEELAAFASERATTSGVTDALLAEARILLIVGGVAGLAGFALASSLGPGGSLPVFLVAYLGIGLGIMVLLRWAVPRLRIKGMWASILGLALIPIFGALMYGTCAAAFAFGRT